MDIIKLYNEGQNKYYIDELNGVHTKGFGTHTDFSMQVSTNTLLIDSITDNKYKLIDTLMKSEEFKKSYRQWIIDNTLKGLSNRDNKQIQDFEMCMFDHKCQFITDCIGGK